MRRRALALLLTLTLGLAPALAGAEAPPVGLDETKVTPLLRAVATALLDAGPESGTAAEGEDLSEAFAAALLGALRAVGLADGSEDPAPLLAGLLTFPVPEAKPAKDVEPLAIRVLITDVSEDADAAMTLLEITPREGPPVRAAVELRAAEDAPLGWRVARITRSDAPLIEALLDVFFSSILVEYIHTDNGYTIQYPAIFPEDSVMETDAGLQAALPDESASFAVARRDNPDHLTLELLLEQERALYPDADISVNAFTGCGRVVAEDEQGMIHAVLLLVSRETIVQAELNYIPARAAELSPYVDYMENSFTLAQ